MRQLSALMLSALLLAGAPAAQAAGASEGSLGDSCARDQDCGSGLFCLTGTEADGVVPPGGLCTVRCSAEPDLCAELSSGAACVHLAPAGLLEGDYCVEGCAAPRCHDRNDFSCRGKLTTLPCSSDPPGAAPTDSQCARALGGFAYCQVDAPPVGPGPGAPPGMGGAPGDLPVTTPDTGTCYATDLCLPTCLSDEACPPGLHCNPGTGLCDARGRTGDPPGALCDPLASSCAGWCEPLQDAPRCYEGCIIGRACGSSTLSSARCISQLAQAEQGTTGLCMVLCSCDSECESQLGPSFYCEAADNPVLYGFPDAAAVANLGFRGSCRQVSPASPAGAILGERWCEAGAGSTCKVATKACHGKSGCLGVAECQPDGSFGECVCADPGSSTGAEAATGGAAADTTPPAKAKDSGSCSVARAANPPERQAVGWLLLAMALSGSRRWRRAPRRAPSGEHHG